ncbi:MAG: hypothetical protein NC543_09415 [bacterium]|nr:hypothetical protein [bacterium]MCM1375683.1 hypothetical protein [Muribaculum sp.]
MRIKILLLTACLLLLAGCGKDPVTAKFNSEINGICENISAIDAKINAIHVEAEENSIRYATSDLLSYLDELEVEFLKFSNLDFPTEFDYLEDMAKEAGTYMKEAVSSYHNAYENGYDESMEEYARENYSRACKRVQIALALLRGEEIGG